MINRSWLLKQEKEAFVLCYDNTAFLYMSALSPPIHEYRMVMDSVDLHSVYTWHVSPPSMCFSPPSPSPGIPSVNTRMLPSTCQCFCFPWCYFYLPVCPSPSLCPPHLMLLRLKVHLEFTPHSRSPCADSFIKIHRHHFSLSLAMMVIVFFFFFSIFTRVQWQSW